ncbi:hypothetical protein L2E82_44055 [Cichorium intybus]|uniref:Uncharacterized protein n=1 Tax=Cichorium intybus TaxID=13427 RepID=A0ACB8ZQ69_CICIN|nr:hypothetical protein L2E82_44055 [Cichorium intybus]
MLIRIFIFTLLAFPVATLELKPGALIFCCKSIFNSFGIEFYFLLLLINIEQDGFSDIENEGGDLRSLVKIMDRCLETQL